VALPVAEPLAEEGWLGSVNRTLYAFNREVRGHVAAISERLPSLGTLNPKFRDGAGNLLNTWIAEPWQALSLAAAGRPADSWKVLDRVAVNITQGSGGLRDLATERGMPTAPYADIGLALCARGVPEGRYVVLPVVGGRTLRDGLSDIIVANALIYASLVPFTGPTPPLEVFIAVEILDNIPAWLLAERIGRANNVDQARMNFEEARRAYLAARRTACDALRASP
jgi:phospholipid-binding lipoprotein MlaA